MVAEHEEPQPAPRSRPIVWVVGLAAVAALVILVLPAIQAARRAGHRLESSNNLKQIAIGLHDYHDTWGQLPPGGTIREDGTGLHGWPSHIIAFLFANPWGDRIDRSIPWDDPTQVDTFIQMNFHCFVDPGNPQQKTADGIPVIHYAANERLMFRESAVTFGDIEDRSTTLMVADAFGEFAPMGFPFNWRDPSIAFQTSQRQFGNAVRRDTLVAFVDGRVESFHSDTDANVLAKFAGPSLSQPTPEQIEQPGEPYRLQNQAYWRLLFEDGKMERDVRFRLSPDSRYLEALFADYIPEPDESTKRWRTSFPLFVKARPIEHIKIVGTLDATELEPFLAIPTLKRLSIRSASVYGDKEAVLGKARKTIVID